MKTVMQEIMFKAGRMIKHAGRWVLGLGANDSAHTVFERLYKQLSPEHKTSPAWHRAWRHTARQLLKNSLPQVPTGGGAPRNWPRSPERCTGVHAFAGPGILEHGGGQIKKKIR